MAGSREAFEVQGSEEAIEQVCRMPRRFPQSWRQNQDDLEAPYRRPRRASPRAGGGRKQA